MKEILIKVQIRVKIQHITSKNNKDPNKKHQEDTRQPALTTPHLTGQTQIPSACTRKKM
jgi:hypothetical protein